MRGRNSMFLNLRIDNKEGFSLVEVLVAFSILAIVLVTVFESRFTSTRRVEQTGDLKQIQNMVRVDLARIRGQALKWQCVQGTACTGQYENKDHEARYHNTHCTSNIPLSEFPLKTEVLSSENNKIQLTRNVEMNGKQLDITYSWQASGKDFSTSASIIPQAMNWCS